MRRFRDEKSGRGRIQSEYGHWVSQIGSCSFSDYVSEPLDERSILSAQELCLKLIPKADSRPK